MRRASDFTFFENKAHCVKRCAFWGVFWAGRGCGFASRSAFEGIDKNGK
jgi:hypothetical protein